MLIQFSVENFLSIKEKVVLSLLASKDNEHPNHLIADETNRYLKSAVIYGANASGKSNVLNAFWFMVNYVLTSHNQQIHKAIDRSPFKFDPETPTRPSSFEVIFTTKGICLAFYEHVFKGTSQNKIFTVNDISSILGIGRGSAYKLANSGLLKTIRIGNIVRISRKSFEDWLKAEVLDDETE